MTNLAVIIVLGAPNEDDGTLSPIAAERGNLAAHLYQQLKSSKHCKVLCTGGMGEHFNRSSLPHWQWQQDHLRTLGVDQSDFLAGISSRFTFEDATLARDEIDVDTVQTLHIVTSGFHLARVAFIFDALFDDVQRVYHGAKVPVTVDEYAHLLAHERAVMKREHANVRKYQQS
ncbi:YdcF family protein [Pseudoalteromonas pernae]|uniref:YdcF family protein n=1 Tax=Pseudoalteromonas pernae TaxID=3118054 RepID=UPI003242E125